MNIAAGIPNFDAPVADHARKDFPLLDANMTVGNALERIRREGVGERVIYFYAVDEQKRLVGVVPTRRLLTASLETPLSEIMVRRVVAVPATATVLDACEFFVLYKFLAFPVVDDKRRVIGIIDANLFAEEILEAGESEDRYRPTAPVGPEFFEATLARSLVLAFFLTMVLALNESVSMQSMSVTIHALRSISVTSGWLASAFRREAITALLLGVACGLVVSAIVFMWRNDLAGAFVIGGSIAVSLVSACVLGLGVPSLLHRFKLDLKIAAGPVTLAIADFVALVIYFTSAWLVVR